MIQYVDTVKDRFGVEAICRTLRATGCGFITARGYRAAKTRPLSARAMSDHLLGAEIGRLPAENYGVYGVRKMHALMRRQGWVIGCDQTGRIMRSLGLRGVKRSKRVFTTKSDPAAAKPKDLVQRQFTAGAPRDQQPTPQDPRLEDPGRSVQRAATVAPTTRCCIDRLNSSKPR